MKLHPLADNLVATPLKAEAKTVSGLYIPDSAKEKPQMAEVIAVGKDVKEVKIGDKIIYSSKYDSSKEEVRMHGKDTLIMKEEDVLVIVKA